MAPGGIDQAKLDALWAMSPDDRAAAAKAMYDGMIEWHKRTPQQPEGSPAWARATLTAWQSDPEIIEALRNGDAETQKAFALLTERANEDKIDRLIDGSYTTPVGGETVTDGEINSRDAMAQIKDLRNIGITDDAVFQELLENKPVPAATYDYVESRRSEFVDNPEWSSGYLPAIRSRNVSWRC